MSHGKNKVILDVDTGVDDALAILFALLSPTLDVVGITTSFGNVDVETATKNTLRLVELCGADVPVCRGAAQPLIRPWTGPVPWIHGHNGLGDATLEHPIRSPEETDAAHFIRDVVKQYPGEVTIIPVARMTNLARALLFDLSLAEQLKGVVLMGGAAFCPGNVTPVAEANIWGDPEAAKVLFQSGADITMVGLDVTMKTRLSQAQVETLDERRPYARLVREATAFYMQAYEARQGASGPWCPLHDPLAVGVAEDASLCDMRTYPVDVSLEGMTTGMTVVDARTHSDEEANVRVCVDVDAHRFVNTFCNRLGMVTGRQVE